MRPHRAIYQKINRIASIFVDRKVDFIIAGTIKGGTTALDAYVRAHPQIGMSYIKEARFFDNADFFRHNKKPSIPQYHALFADVWLRKLLGEATPNYMYSPAAPERIRAYNPNMKLIMVLRNPVDRAYSHWNMERQLTKETRTFSEAFRQELANGINGLAEQPGFAYVHRGFYTEQLERIWKFFPKEQTLVLKNEELRKNHFETLNGVCRFLGVAPQKTIPALEYHARSYEQPILPEDKKFLQGIFRDEIKKLEQLLGWDCGKWVAD